MRKSAPTGRTTHRVTLHRITHMDQIGTKRWCRWLNDKSVSRYLESSGRWMPSRLNMWVRAQVENPEVRLYAVQVGGRPVGTLKLNGVKRGGWPSLGLMIGEKDQWGKGIGTAAIERACEIAKKAGCLGVWAGMRGTNMGSYSAFINAGFEYAAVKEVIENAPSELRYGVGAWSWSPLRRAVMRRF